MSWQTHSSNSKKFCGGGEGGGRSHESRLWLVSQAISVFTHPSIYRVTFYTFLGVYRTSHFDHSKRKCSSSTWWTQSLAIWWKKTYDLSNQWQNSFPVHCKKLSCPLLNLEIVQDKRMRSCLFTQVIWAVCKDTTCSFCKLGSSVWNQ